MKNEKIKGTMNNVYKIAMDILSIGGGVAAILSCLTIG